jgi:hypothetical protein
MLVLTRRIGEKIVIDGVISVTVVAIRGRGFNPHRKVKIMEKNEATHKCKIFLHIRDHGKWNWTNERYDFARVPAVGEYVSTSTSGEWFKVQLVLHTPSDRESTRRAG